MTSPDTQPATTTDPDTPPPGALLEELEDDGEYKPPFLRITASYPVVSGSPEHVTVEMNLDDGPLGEEDQPVGDGSGGVKSWFTDFCTNIVRELRSGRPAIVVAMNNTGVTPAHVRSLLEERLAQACDQPAEQTAVEDPRATNGEPAPTDEHDSTVKDGQ